MHKRYLTLLLLVCPLVGQAKDLGSWGDVWPVQEQSFLALIQDRLQGLQDNGQLAELQQQFQDRVVEHTLRPTPVEGLVTDTQAHTSWYDPTFVVGQTLADGASRQLVILTTGTSSHGRVKPISGPPIMTICSLPGENPAFSSRWRTGVPRRAQTLPG